MNSYITLFALLISSIVSASAVQAEELYSLKNLERERAALLSAYFDDNLDRAARHKKTDFLQRRLIDVERMVLRDDRLVNSHTKLAQHAFENYEVTFLVHAGAETKSTPLNHWLAQFSLSDESLLNTKPGYR